MDKLVKALKNPRLALFLLVEKLSFCFLIRFIFNYVSI